MNNKQTCANCGAYSRETSLSKQDEQQSNKAGYKNHLEQTPYKKISLKSLIGSKREVIIEHNDEDYCLRRTNRNKLILTKVQLSVLFSSMLFSLADS